MNKINIKSSLVNVYQQFIAITDLNTAKQFIKDHINSTSIKEQDKKKMCYEIEFNIKTTPRLQYYITNALLKYEGLSVSMNREAK